MKRNAIWVIFITLILVVRRSSSVEDEVKTSLIKFATKLSGGDSPGLFSGWNMSTDPCEDRWRGVYCGGKKSSVRKLFLNDSNLAGELDIGLLCDSVPLSASLSILHLERNNLTGELSSAVSSCQQLSRVHLSSNRLTGELPASLASLTGLKIIDVSENRFSGAFPDFSGISGLTTFYAQSNGFSGEVPRLDYSSLTWLNVSYNRLTGQVPEEAARRFRENSFFGNSELCGDPTPNECPASEPDSVTKDSSGSKNSFIMFAGYIVLGIVVVLIVLFLLYKRRNGNKKAELETKGSPSKEAYRSSTVHIMTEEKSGFSRHSEMSAVSAENSVLGSSSLVLLTSPKVEGLRFEDLLQAPAEMLGRGRDGSVYKVCMEEGKNLVVKRIKNWPISSQEFKRRMERLDQLKHPNVLPTLAFYSSKEEKLMVYDYHPNGSLFTLLHGTNTAREFDWNTRLNVASSLAEALAFMHDALRDDDIAHGNVKSSNIFLDDAMEPRLSEYGLKAVSLPASRAFKDDVHGFGVVLLELLTGNLVNHNGVDLTEWVHSVVREEWTGEVFDKSLLAQCASEERMVSLLQVAVRCVNRSPEARPTMSQVVAMIAAIKEEEDRSSMASGP